MAKRLARAWRCRIVALPRRYPLDRAVVDGRGRVRALIEVKCRRYARGTYPDYMVSAMKIAEAMAVAGTMAVPVILAVRLRDALLWHRVAPPYEARIGGRRDRGDPDDVEPVLHIPFEQFEGIEDAGAEADCGAGDPRVGVPG